MLLTSTNDQYIRGWRYTSNGFVLAHRPDNEEEPFEKHLPYLIY